MKKRFPCKGNAKGTDWGGGAERDGRAAGSGAGARFLDGTGGEG